MNRFISKICRLKPAKTVLTILLLFIGVMIQAATVTSLTTGNWSATAWPNTLRTGTIISSTASLSITGTNTLFLSEISIGNVIKTTGGTTIGTVASITDNTHITLISNASSTNNNIGYSSQGVGSADAVIIANNAKIYVDKSYTCYSLSCAGTTSITSLTINSGFTLTVSGAVTMEKPTNSITNSLIVGDGFLIAGSFTMKASTTGKNDVLSINNGAATINGDVNVSATGCLITFTAAGTINVSGNFSSKPTITQFNGNTWNYNGAAQTALSISYNNLTLSGSGIKTISGVTVKGILSMEGTATASVNPAYGTAATLQYNTGTSCIAGPEWISPFVASGGIIIANTGTITLNSDEIVNSLLTINAGASLSTSSSSYSLTFGGNFINNGTLSANGSAITISGTGTQSISGFTTTGSVTMTKTAGIATLTGNMACGSLVINGIGGTLNLGAGLSHIIAGVWTLSNGTVAGSSSTITISGNASTTSGTFAPGTSTVIYNGTNAPQSTANVPYYNLILSGTGSKTLLSGSNAIGNDLTFSGTASFTALFKMTIAGNITIGAGTTFSGTAFIHNLGGNFTNNGTYTTGTGGINFNGTANQIVAGSGTNLFNMMTISNASGVSLSGNASVTGTLSFVSGKISTGAYSLSLGNFAVVAGTGTGKYVNGSLQMGIPAATTVRTFDIGDATVFTPVTLSFTGTTNGTGSITMNTITGNSPNISTSNLNPALNVNRYWTITNNGVTGFSSYDATFTFVAGDIDAGADYTSFIAGEYSSSSWSYPVVGTTNSTSIQVMGITTFGQFQSGESAALSGTQYGGNGSTPSISGIFPCINMPSNPLIISSSFAVHQYFTMNVIKGLSYEVYTCNTTAPANPLTLTVYKEGAPGEPYIAFSAVNTGNTCSSFSNDVYVSFTPSFSGEVRVLVNRKGNSGSTSPAGLTIKANVTGGSNTLDDQAMAGADKWVGHIYDGIAFNNYLGYYLPGTETFQEAFGTTGTWPNNANDDATCFSLLSGGAVHASVLDISFSVRYRMNSSRRGLFAASITSDDGSGLSVDNNFVYSNWSDHSPIISANVLFNLTGSSSLSFEYYENGGQNVAGFTGLVQILSNTLTQNVNQSIYLNGTGLSISGDVFGTLPTGITLSGTGYQWAYSSVSSTGPWTNITGATSATFTPSSTVAPFNNAGTYYVIRKVALSSINNIAPNPYLAVNESNAAVITIKMPAGTWLGVTSNDWHTASNWSGGVPTYTTDAVISSGTPYQPSINSNIAYCHNITINTGCILTINAAAQLLTAGTIVNNAGTGGLILQSDATGTATLIHNTDNIQATVNRYISGGAEAWHLLSSPLSNQNIAADWLPAGTYGNGTGYDMYVWDEASSCWIYKLNTTSVKNWNTVHPSANFMVGRGYLYSVQSSNSTKQFKGVLNNGNINIPVTAAGTNLSLSGFNLVGNPYPSSIDWQAITGWSRTGLVPSGSGYDMWIWNPAASNYGVINSAGGNGTNGVTKNISSMQGFFVRAKSSGNLGLTNDIRVIQSTSWLKRSMVTSNSNLSITVNSGDGMGFDEVQLCFGSENNESGAMKLFSPVETAPGLYLSIKDQNYSLRYLTDTVDNPAVPIMFKSGFDGNYTLRINDVSEQFEQIILEDTQLHSFQDIKLKNSYQFKSLKTDDNKRFILHFTKIQKTKAADMPVLVYTTKNKLVVNLEQVNLETEVIVIDMMGRILLKEKLQGESVNELSVNSKTQVLIVTLRNQIQTICRKVMWINS